MAEFHHFYRHRRMARTVKLGDRELIPMEPAVVYVSQEPLPRFASLSDATMSASQQRSRLTRFFLAPFVDIDERVARLAAASRAERDSRKAAMFDGGGSPRS
jgi:hypothetical protein